MAKDVGKLTVGQLLTLARAAGFSSTRRHLGLQEDRMAVAIALGESGGDPRAHNPVPPDNSYGLWQINMIGNLGPARRKQFGIKSNDELFNPAINARAAKMVFDEVGGSFRPWSVYTSGSWLRYRSKVQNAEPSGSVPTPEQVEEGGGNWWDVFFEVNPWWDDSGPIDVRDPVTDALDDVGNALGQINNFFGFISDTENWKRVGYFIAGGLLVGVGLYMLVDLNTNINPAKYIPQARAVRKVVKGG